MMKYLTAIMLCASMANAEGMTDENRKEYKQRISMAGAIAALPDTTFSVGWAENGGDGALVFGSARTFGRIKVKAGHAISGDHSMTYLGIGVDF
jgi:hypothetical protein